MTKADLRMVSDLRGQIPTGSGFTLRLLIAPPDPDGHGAVELPADEVPPQALTIELASPAVARNRHPICFRATKEPRLVRHVGVYRDGLLLAYGPISPEPRMAGIEPITFGTEDVAIRG